MLLLLVSRGFGMLVWSVTMNSCSFFSIRVAVNCALEVGSHTPLSCSFTKVYVKICYKDIGGGVGWGCGFYIVFLFIKKKQNFFPLFFFVREAITL